MWVVVAGVLVAGDSRGVSYIHDAIIADIDDFVLKSSAIHFAFMVLLVADVAGGCLVAAGCHRRGEGEQTQNDETYRQDSFHVGSSIWWFQ